MAELDKEMRLGLINQGDSSIASAPTFPRPRSVKAPQDEIQSRESTYITGSGLQELQDISRHGTVQGPEEWEQPKTEAVGKGRRSDTAGGACSTEGTTLAASCG